MTFPFNDRVIQRVAEDKVRSAMEAGAFDNLPGAGKPLECLDEPWDEMWWIKRWIRREGLAAADPGLTSGERRAVIAGLASIAARRSSLSAAVEARMTKSE